MLPVVVLPSHAEIRKRLETVSKKGPFVGSLYPAFLRTVSEGDKVNGHDIVNKLFAATSAAASNDTFLRMEMMEQIGYLAYALIDGLPVEIEDKVIDKGDLRPIIKERLRAINLAVPD